MAALHCAAGGRGRGPRRAWTGEGHTTERRLFPHLELESGRALSLSPSPHSARLLSGSRSRSRSSARTAQRADPLCTPRRTATALRPTRRSPPPETHPRLRQWKPSTPSRPSARTPRSSSATTSRACTASSSARTATSTLVRSVSPPPSSPLRRPTFAPELTSSSRPLSLARAQARTTRSPVRARCSLLGRFLPAETAQLMVGNRASSRRRPRAHARARARRV